jgi:hypothetical protein
MSAGKMRLAAKKPGIPANGVFFVEKFCGKIQTNPGIGKFLA